MKQEEFETEDRTPKKGVFITVYVESSKGSQNNSISPSKRLGPKRFTNRRQKASSNNYYDRRAQLLAYAKELREAASHEKVQWLARTRRISPPHKFKRQERWLKIPRQIRSSFQVMLDGTKKLWKYERIISGGDPQRKRNSKWRINANFCRRFMCMLKQVSCGWRCNKGV